jgi:hypothetical protein
LKGGYTEYKGLCPLQFLLNVRIRFCAISPKFHPVIFAIAPGHSFFLFGLLSAIILVTPRVCSFVTMLCFLAPKSGEKVPDRPVNLNALKLDYFPSDLF